jgi:hypothetical protein
MLQHHGRGLRRIIRDAGFMPVAAGHAVQTVLPELIPALFAAKENGLCSRPFQHSVKVN